MTPKEDYFLHMDALLTDVLVLMSNVKKYTEHLKHHGCHIEFLDQAESLIREKTLDGFRDLHYEIERTRFRRLYFNKLKEKEETK